MVKIAIAGGSGNVGQEIIDDAPAGEATPDITWIKTDYKDPTELTLILQGVHTLLSFASEQEDPSSPVQKRLIDAAVQAGVKRFAPSEWATAGLEHLSWYAYKAETRRYLEELNKDKKVASESLVEKLENLTQENIYGSDDDRITFTSVHDLANVVAMAIDFEAEWPVVGGIRGTDISIGQLIALGEKVRGGLPFDVEKLKAGDLENGNWETLWLPKIDHPSIPLEQVEAFSKVGVAGILLAISANAFAVSNEWNRLLPEYKFTQMEDFLTTEWSCKP
ncbi:hypothetical protein N7474_010898 [Penicillium riverlandense]|uniref:uncharacterized protein n=1 Tax=Penicillium riverlandense TaxID=1903569 RepID=UPI00254688F7|nr:uncharacterized protein N7474_010898 [Penicillium riverlandense]KAJ5805011.1 hypothetical protein N7474_010898 [Penicillium riverlandense]